MCKEWLTKAMAWALVVSFSLTGVVPAGWAQSVSLPPAGEMVELSPQFSPCVMKGIRYYPKEPFRYDFIVDPGDMGLSGPSLKDESTKLIKYFLASLTTPSKDLWVNLSPYEGNRIIPEAFGQTEMGRDLLGQDYLLKQISSSLIHPDTALGKKFWDAVYAKAYERFGKTDIPLETFHKVWIVPDKADIYIKGSTAYVVNAHLKLMMENDYLAEGKNDAPTEDLSNQVMREVILPELEKEVNQGKNFARVRQVYYSLVLAVWLKGKVLRNTGRLADIYIDKNKTLGVQHGETGMAARIWQQYVESFKKGVFNFIKEEESSYDNEILPRKYFSGGADYSQLASSIREVSASEAEGKVASARVEVVQARFSPLQAGLESKDAAMAALKPDKDVVFTMRPRQDPKLTMNGQELPFSSAENHLRYRAYQYKSEQGEDLVVRVYHSQDKKTLRPAERAFKALQNDWRGPDFIREGLTSDGEHHYVIVRPQKGPKFSDILKKWPDLSLTKQAWFINELKDFYRYLIEKEIYSSTAFDGGIKLVDEHFELIDPLGLEEDVYSPKELASKYQLPIASLPMMSNVRTVLQDMLRLFLITGRFGDGYADSSVTLNLWKAKQYVRRIFEAKESLKSTGLTGFQQATGIRLGRESGYYQRASNPLVIYEHPNGLKFIQRDIRPQVWDTLAGLAGEKRPGVVPFILNENDKTHYYELYLDGYDSIGGPQVNQKFILSALVSLWEFTKSFVGLKFSGTSFDVMRNAATGDIQRVNFTREDSEFLPITRDKEQRKGIFSLLFSEGMLFQLMEQHPELFNADRAMAGFTVDKDVALKFASEEDKEPVLMVAGKAAERIGKGMGFNNWIYRYETPEGKNVVYRVLREPDSPPPDNSRNAFELGATYKITPAFIKEGLTSDGKHYFMVAEFIGGENVLDILNQWDELSAQKREEVLEKVKAFYKYLIENQIYSADLWPPNLHIVDGKVILVDAEKLLGPGSHDFSKEGIADVYKTLLETVIVDGFKVPLEEMLDYFIQTGHFPSNDAMTNPLVSQNLWQELGDEKLSALKREFATNGTRNLKMPEEGPQLLLSNDAVPQVMPVWVDPIAGKRWVEKKVRWAFGNRARHQDAIQSLSEVKLPGVVPAFAGNEEGVYFEELLEGYQLLSSVEGLVNAQNMPFIRRFIRETLRGSPGHFYLHNHLHAKNIMVKVEGEKIVDLKIIDFKFLYQVPLSSEESRKALEGIMAEDLKEEQGLNERQYVPPINDEKDLEIAPPVLSALQRNKFAVTSSGDFFDPAQAASDAGGTGYKAEPNNTRYREIVEKLEAILRPAYDPIKAFAGMTDEEILHLSAEGREKALRGSVDLLFPREDKSDMPTQLRNLASLAGPEEQFFTQALDKTFTEGFLAVQNGEEIGSSRWDPVNTVSAFASMAQMVLGSDDGYWQKRALFLKSLAIESVANFENDIFPLLRGLKVADNIEYYLLAGGPLGTGYFVYPVLLTEQGRKSGQDSSQKELTPGGIDLNTDRMKLDVSGDTQKTASFAGSSLDNLSPESIQGFSPVIIGMEPVGNVRDLLGMGH
ncbi:MAG: hypothetical protein HQL16_06675 [Candidatus Omnitrophica bacterium]|nr:hypothetical protein [Candidatus Omnitrophota bacterium]